MKLFTRWMCAHFAWALFFTGSSLPASAQEAPTGDHVRAELRLFLWQTTGASIETDEKSTPAVRNEAVTAEFYIAKGKELVTVKCEAQEYSEPVAYLGPRKFQLFRKGSGNAASAIPGYEVAAEAMLPTGGGRYILFLDGGLKSPRIMVFPYDAGAGAKGQLMLFNATDRGLGVRVGTEKKTLAPNALVKFPVASFTDYQMPFEVFEKIQETWQSRISTRSAILFDDQNLGILYQRPNDKQVAFTLLPNVLWEEAKPQ